MNVSLMDKVVKGYLEIYKKYSDARKTDIIAVSPICVSTTRKNKSRKEEVEIASCFVWDLNTMDVGTGKDIRVAKEENDLIGKELQQLALEPNPEALFHAMRHVKFRENNPSVCIAPLDKLFPPSALSISSYRKTIERFLGEYAQNHQREIFGKNDQLKKFHNEEANRYARTEWRKRRERILCGSSEMYEEGKTLDWITKYVLPVATIDIWESLDELFNGEDACVPTNDRDAFNDLYKEYKEKHVDWFSAVIDVDDTTTENDQKSLTFETSEQLLKTQTKKDIYGAIDKYKKKNSTILDLLYAFYAEKHLINDEEIEEKDKCQKQITKIFNLASPKACTDFVMGKELSYIQLATKGIPNDWVVLKNILSRSKKISDCWRNVICGNFNGAMNNADDSIGWWISTMYDCGIYEDEIGDNLDLWKKISPEKATQIIPIIDKCIIKPKAVENILQLIFDNKEGDENLLSTWNRIETEIVRNYLNQSGNIGISLYSYMTKFCRDSKGYVAIINAMSEIYRDKSNEAKYSDKKNYQNKDIVDSLNTMKAPMDELRHAIDAVCNAGLESEISSIKRAAEELNNCCEYIVDFWKNKE